MMIVQSNTVKLKTPITSAGAYLILAGGGVYLQGEVIPQEDPPPCNGDYKGYYISILGSSYIPIIPLLQGGGST